MRQITVRLKPDQFLKEEIKRIAVENNIEAGCIISIVGALKVANLRMAGATPEKQEVKSFEGPLEIVGGTGTVSKNGCHIHMSLSSTDGRVVGGHLKDESPVDLTVELVIAVFDDVVYRRTMDEDTGFPELNVE